MNFEFRALLNKVAERQAKNSRPSAYCNNNNNFWNNNKKKNIAFTVFRSPRQYSSSVFMVTAKSRPTVQTTFLLSFQAYWEHFFECWPYEKSHWTKWSRGHDLISNIKNKFFWKKSPKFTRSGLDSRDHRPTVKHTSFFDVSSKDKSRATNSGEKTSLNGHVSEKSKVNAAFSRECWNLYERCKHVQVVVPNEVRKRLFCRFKN